MRSPLGSAIIKAAIILIYLGVTSGYVFSVLLPKRLDSDILLFSIASTTNPTLFYWGQDRLAQIIPITLQWVKPILANINMTLFVNGLIFCTLCLILSQIADLSRQKNRIVGKHGVTSMAWMLLAACCGIVAFIGFLNSNVAFTFIKHAQPYCLSSLLIAMSIMDYTSTAIILSSTKSKHAPKKFIAYLAFIYLTTIANPLSIFMPISFSASLGILSIKSRNKAYCRDGIFWGCISIFAYILYEITVRIYRQHYGLIPTPTTVSLNGLYHGLRGATIEIFSNAKGFELQSLLLLFACLIATLATIYELKTAYSRPQCYTVAPKICISLYALTTIPIISSDWFRLNAYNFRYLFPLYLYVLFSIIFCARQGAELISGRLQSQITRVPTSSLAPFLCLASIFTIMLSSLRMPPNSINYYDQVAEIEPIYNYYSSTNTTHSIAGGDYWGAWPLKALSISHNTPFPIIANRSDFDPLSAKSLQNLRKLYTERKSILYFCITSKDYANKDCLIELRNKLGLGENSSDKIVVSKQTTVAESKTGKFHMTKLVLGSTMKADDSNAKTSQ